MRFCFPFLFSYLRLLKIFCEMLRQCPNRRTVKEFDNRNLSSDQLLKAKMNLDHQKRMSAKFEKSIVVTDGFDSENLLPDLRNRWSEIPFRADFFDPGFRTASLSGSDHFFRKLSGFEKFSQLRTLNFSNFGFRNLILFESNQKRRRNSGLLNQNRANLTGKFFDRFEILLFRREE